MQPENPQYSIDYLNSISTAPQQKTMKPLYLWLMIAGVLLVVGIVVMFVLSLGSGNKDDLTSFAARLTALETITSDAQENIQSSELRTLNSSLTLTLTDANRDIATYAGEINEKSGAAKTVASETAKLNSTLEDARLNAVYDRTYARELTYYLKNLRTQMSVLYNNTHKSSLKTYLEKVDANIKPLSESIAAFNAD